MNLIGGAWDFMNMGMEVKSNPEVEIPQPLGWANCEEHGSDRNMTITETVAFNKEERPEALPLAILGATLWQSTLNRQPKSHTKRMSKIQAILGSGATNTFMRPQDGAIPTGEISTKRVQMPDGKAIQASGKAKLPWIKLRDKAKECDILPSLEQNSLRSVGKVADAGYYTLLMTEGKGVHIDNSDEIEDNILSEAVLWVWRDQNELWRMPISRC